MSKYKQPITDYSLTNLKNELELKMKSEFSNKAAIMLCVSVGDEVMCDFPSSHISMRKSYSSSVIAKGVVKVDDDNIIYIESVEPVKQTYHTTNNRSGRDYCGWWVEKPKITRAEISRMVVLNEEHGA